MNDPLKPDLLRIPGGRIRLGDPACPPRANFAWIWHTGKTEEIASFQLGRYQVTNAEYRAYLDATASDRPAKLDEQGFNAPDQPVVGISWEDATAYCEWLRQQTGQPYRLPRDAEWEYAARGGRTGSIFPWGDALDPSLACFGGRFAPAPVGSFPPNGFGLYEMIGNAWEWCAEKFADVSAGIKAVNRPTSRDPADNRVVRGGSYMTCHYLNLWIAYRHEDPADLRHESIGFRIAL